jgi:RNA polymerase sigma-70 factor (ECF subfamily)
MVRAWRVAPNWRPGEAKFDTWLHRVALNLCYDRLRRKISTVADPPNQIDPGPSPDRGLHAADTSRLVDDALRALPYRQKEAIILCHFQEFSNLEAAELMGISVEALESLLSRGRRALRMTLSDVAIDG